ncbi:hypothetical protein PGTUg99_035583 [Puccinia graminis f. sp. tritici]|uniref:Uncharacterized protein n=1 Tax=Puccinia graminis f. sp. tritici TaxID=56615 RepID=A0A5B0R9Y7_PUCGR|nr:hypothetical protein PGTUg99_035583 [Puccinia graminis f. sp. tritici]
MRSFAILLGFLTQFSLHNSLPMELLAGSSVSRLSHSVESSPRGPGIAADLTATSTKNSKIPPVFLTDDSHPGNVNAMENEWKTPWSDKKQTLMHPASPASSEKSGPGLSSSSQTSLETFIPPRTSSDEDFLKSPGTISTSSTEASTSRELSLGDELGHSSPEATSQRVNQASTIYRHLLTIAEKPQVQLEKNSYWGRLTTYLDRAKGYSPFGRPKTVLQLTETDASELNIFLLRARQKLNAEDTKVLNEYYQTFSAFSKKSTTMIQSNPDSYKFLSEWEKKHFIPHTIMSNFFKKILSDSEFSRRENVFQLQREQYRIVAGWGKQEKSIQQATGYLEEEVKGFGNLLGGKDFFPSFDKVDSQATLNQIESLEKEKPRLAKAWKDYLEPEEYDSRIQLLNTLAQLKKPHQIPSETISAWRAQGLDVDRMLKIVDYRPGKIEQLVEEGPRGKTQFENLETYQAGRRLFLTENVYGIPWSQSLEHYQLMQASEDVKLKYVDLSKALRAPPRIAPAPLPISPQAPPTPLELRTFSLSISIPQSKYNFVQKFVKFVGLNSKPF